MLKIDKKINIPSNYLGGIFTNESVLVQYSSDGTNLYSHTYDTGHSSWPEPVWETVKLDSNLTNKQPLIFSGECFTSLMTCLVLGDMETMYVHYAPDYGGNYDPKTPYRLYYAHDTDKLYQNVMDEWIFVGTKDHTNLLNAGNLTHDEIDEALSKLTRFKEVQW